MTDTDTATAVVPGRAAPPRGTQLRLARLRDLSLLPVIGLLLIIGFIVSPNFLTRGNLTDVLQQCTELSLLVLGEAMILIAGRMDLSLESTIGVAPVLAVWLAAPRHGGRFEGLDLLPGWTTVPVCLLAGALIGLVNGLVILRVRINAFILTLGMLIALRGLQLGISGGNSIFELPSSFKYLGRAAWLGLPASLWICALLFAVGISGVLLRRSPLVILLCLELMLNAGNLALLAFSRSLGNQDGQVFALIVMVIAACEVVVGLGIIVAAYRRRIPLNVDDLRSLRG